VDDLRFVGTLNEVPALRTRFQADLRASGVESEELEGWALCFTELVNNALEHGCSAAGDRVRVGWGETHGRILVTVTNPGVGCISKEDFDVSDCDDFAETGRGAGLFIIRAWADEIRVHARDGVTEVEVSRRRESPPLATSGGER